MKVGDLVVITSGRKYSGSIGVVTGFLPQRLCIDKDVRVLKAFYPLVGTEMLWPETYLELISESR